MAGKFGSLAQLRNKESGENSVARPHKDEGREGTGPAKGAARGAGPGRPTGKRSDPDYEQTTVFLKKETKRAAIRQLEDSGQKPDLSDLLQSLLAKYISARA